MTLDPRVLLYASLSRRIGAFVIDCFILFVLGLFASQIVPFLGTVVIWFFYAPILESSELRATLGKHLMGIQVADLTGQRISFQASLIRNALKLISMAILFLGFVFALFSSRKQTFHDLLANTVVVYGRSEKAVADAWTDSIKELFRRVQSEVAPASSTTGSEPAADIASQLERLKTMLDNGALTADEYEAAKRKVLS